MSEPSGKGVRMWRTPPSVIVECGCGYIEEVGGTTNSDNARARAKHHAMTTGHRVRVERSFTTYFELTPWLPTPADIDGDPAIRYPPPNVKDGSNMAPVPSQSEVTLSQEFWDRIAQIEQHDPLSRRQLRREPCD